MIFEFNWPSGFRGENVDGRTDDGRTTDAGVTGILIAHLGAFGSGELKSKVKRISYQIYFIILNKCTVKITFF